MDVVKKTDGKYAIVHSGREVDMDFSSEGEAWAWADRCIDDQAFDSPNWLAPPIVYRSPAPVGRVDH